MKPRWSESKLMQPLNSYSKFNWNWSLNKITTTPSLNRIHLIAWYGLRKATWTFYASLIIFSQPVLETIKTILKQSEWLLQSPVDLKVFIKINRDLVDDCVDHRRADREEGCFELVFKKSSYARWLLHFMNR